jgi:hypothetical protein
LVLESPRKIFGNWNKSISLILASYTQRDNILFYLYIKTLLPTKINKKLASKKLDILNIFLLAFNRLIPSNVSQRPKQIKTNGKKSSGLDLLAIIFRENKGKSIAKLRLII